MTLPAIRPLIRKTLAALVREQAVIDTALKELLQRHATPALRSSKGLRPMFQVSVLSLLPELGGQGGADRCVRKLLTIINARRREQLRGGRRSRLNTHHKTVAELSRAARRLQLE